jgi:hypothetical protein
MSNILSLDYGPLGYPVLPEYATPFFPSFKGQSRADHLPAGCHVVYPGLSSYKQQASSPQVWRHLILWIVKSDLKMAKGTISILMNFYSKPKSPEGGGILGSENNKTWKHFQFFLLLHGRILLWSHAMDINVLLHTWCTVKFPIVFIPTFKEHLRGDFFVCYVTRAQN